MTRKNSREPSQSDYVNIFDESMALQIESLRLSYNLEDADIINLFSRFVLSKRMSGEFGVFAIECCEISANLLEKDK